MPMIRTCDFCKMEIQADDTHAQRFTYTLTNFNTEEPHTTTPNETDLCGVCRWNLITTINEIADAKGEQPCQ